MTKRELIDYCLSFPNSYEDYPFGEETAVIRHGGNNKMFALISEREGKLYINLKCDPMEADFLREIYVSITPGWHMNKVHWNSVYLNGDVDEHKLYELIAHSFSLIKPKQKGS